MSNTYIHTPGKTNFQSFAHVFTKQLNSKIIFSTSYSQQPY